MTIKELLVELKGGNCPKCGERVYPFCDIEGSVIVLDQVGAPHILKCCATRLMVQQFNEVVREEVTGYDFRLLSQVNEL